MAPMIDAWVTHHHTLASVGAVGVFVAVLATVLWLAWRHPYDRIGR